MSNLIKINNAALKVGNSVLSYTSVSAFGTLITTIPFSPNSKQITVDVTGNRLFVSTSTGTTSVLDLTSYAVLTTFAGYCTCIHNESGKIYVGKTNGITVLDLTTYAVLSTVTTVNSSAGIAIDNDSNKFICSGGGTVSVFNLTTFAAINTITGPNGNSFGVMIDKELNRFYIGGYQGHYYIYDFTTYALIGDITSMSWPGAGVIEKGKNRLLIAEPGGSGLRVFNRFNPTISGILGTFASPRLSSVDFDDSRIFCGFDNSTGIKVIKNTYL